MDRSRLVKYGALFLLALVTLTIVTMALQRPSSGLFEFSILPWD